MVTPDLIQLFVEPLNRIGTQYMIAGSVASMNYGEPRLTLDIDLVVHLEAQEIHLLRKAFPSEQYYLPPEEIIAIELKRSRRGHFNVIHPESGYKADFYPSTDHPLHFWGLKNRIRKEIGETSIWYAPPEYVILLKLEYYREGKEGKHLRDIQSMLTISGDLIKNEWIDEKAAELDLVAAWKLAKGGDN